MVNSLGTIKEIQEYADQNNIPIMMEEGIDYLINYIKKNSVKTILEIGSAIGYSAIRMALSDPDIVVTSIERDEKRYLEAIKNVKKFQLEDRIHLIYHDALDVHLNEKFDLIFIDAAKAQNIKFFEMFQNNLSTNGTIITDNLKFHGLVDEDSSNIKSRNLKQLVRKIKDYISFLEENQRFVTEFIDIGDGLSVSKRKS